VRLRLTTAVVTAMVLPIVATVSTASAAAVVPYQFDGLAFYQFGPPADLCCGPGGSPDTGFVRITNNGASTFVGDIGFHAIQCTGGDWSDSFSVTLNPGDHFSFSFNPESSNFGGFNGPCGGVQNGAQFFMNGTVSLGTDTQSVNLSIFDEDIHSGVPRTNPFGVTLDNYILQGGDPLGRDTGDAYEVTQAPGPFQFAQAGPPPEDQPITASGTTFNAVEGARFSSTVATFTDPDPNSTAIEYAATIDWGDGSSSPGTISGPPGGPFTVSDTHTYTEDGTYAVTVTITDADTPSNNATARSTANVADAHIAAVCSAPPVSPMAFNGPVATLTDANPNGTVADFTATIQWGDGASSSGAVTGPTGGPFTVSGSHSYSSTGFFTMTVSIVDDGGSTATTECVVLIFGTSAGGNFVIGDLNSAVGTAVTFWGAQWAKLNSLSGGPAPSAFKGFEDTPSTPPSCRTNWSTDPGNSTPPPAGPLPEFIAVIVSSSIFQSGSTISGNTPHVVVVRTEAGYAPNVGNAGTGTVVAMIC